MHGLRKGWIPVQANSLPFLYLILPRAPSLPVATVVLHTRIPRLIMPAERSAKRKAGSSDSSHVEPCIICGKVVSRPSDIPRHMSKHDSDVKKLPCPWEGCNFRTLQKSNLDTHYRRHTQDRPFLCRDDPTCEFKSCDPASLLRHRKRRHNYVPKSSGSRKTNKPYTAPARRKASVDSSSVASPSSLESFSGSSTPASTSPSSSSNSLSPSYSPLSEGIESTISISSSPETASSLLNESISSTNSLNSPLHRQESLLFSDNVPPCSYNFAWDASLLPELELDLLATDPELEQFEFEYSNSYQDQQEESQAQPKHLFPLQLPNLEQVLPGYGTTGQLDGSYGLDFGLEQHMQVHSWKVDNSAWFGLSANGSPILYHHNLPADSFQAPSEIDCSPVVCSPVRTGSLELDMEATSSSELDISFASGVPRDTELAQMASSSDSISFNPPHPLSTFANSTISPDATNPQFHQATFAPIPTNLNAGPNLADLSASSPNYFDRCQLTNMNAEINPYLHQTNANPDLIDLSMSGLDYFDQCRWDFGFRSTSSGIIEGPPSGGLENTVTLSS